MASGTTAPLPSMFRTRGNVTVVATGPVETSGNGHRKIQCLRLTGGRHGLLHVSDLIPLNDAARRLLTPPTLPTSTDGYQDLVTDQLEQATAALEEMHHALARAVGLSPMEPWDVLLNRARENNHAADKLSALAALFAEVRL